MNDSLQILYFGTAEQNQVVYYITEIEKHINVDLSPVTDVIHDLGATLSTIGEGGPVEKKSAEERLPKLIGSAKNELLKLDARRIILAGVDRYGHLLLENASALKEKQKALREMANHATENQALYEQKLQSFSLTLKHAEQIAEAMNESYQRYTRVSNDLEDAIKLAEVALRKMKGK